MIEAGAFTYFQNGYMMIGLLVFSSLIILYLGFKNFRLNRYMKELRIVRNNLYKEIEEKQEAEEKAVKLANIIRFSDDAIIGKDMNGIITSWNQGAENTFAWTADEVIGKHISILYTEGTKDEIEEIRNNIRCGIKVNNLKTQRRRKNGKVIDVLLTVSPVKNSRGIIVGTSSISRDITEHVENQRKIQSSYEELSAVYSQLAAAEEELRAQYDELLNREMELRNSEERYKLALEVANDGIVEWDILKDTFFLSDKWHKTLDIGNKNTGFLKHLKSIVHKDDMVKIIHSYKNHSRNSEEMFKCEFRLKNEDGSYRWIYFKGKMIRNEKRKRPIKFIGSLTDISARVEYQEKIKYLANYDHLTGLPNKEAFFKSLERGIKNGKDGEVKGAVIAIDLDEFKIINDTLGHAAGDKVLIGVTDILKEITNNEHFLSRIGGDEYVILMDNVDNLNKVVNICRELVKINERPIKINEKDIYTAISVGVAIYPDNGIDKETIFKNVDTALYESKKRGKNRCTFFDKTLSENIMRRDKLEKGLREALDKDELMLAYQPKVDINDESVHGFEALIRWKHNELGWVSPVEFIEVAEERGLIGKVGNWVIEQAAKQHKLWKEKDFKYKSISINISPKQMQNEKFLNDVKQIIDKYEIEPNSLEFEITENTLMEDFKNNIEVLKDIRENEVEISLDDFGTGYSSLSYLKELPIDILKIDKSFIDDIENNSQRRDIVDGIIQLAHKIKLVVVAEGVENHEQLEILKELKCDLVQGYYFSKPVSSAEIEEKYFNN